MAKIKHGFSGQRLIVYPFYVIEQALNNPLVADLVVHSMGYCLLYTSDAADE